MTSLIRISLVALTLMGAALMTMGAGQTQAAANDPIATGQNRFSAGRTIELASSKPAIEMFRGVIASVDESSDTIRIIRRPSEAAEEFRVQDGLLFNSVRYGDQVEVTVESIDGAKTIIGLSKQ